MTDRFAELQAVLAKIDGKFNEIEERHGSRMVCRAGCHGCCLPGLSVSRLERDHIAAWLAEHPTDRGLADHMAGRGDRARSAEQRRGEELQLEARRHHDVFDRLGAVTCPTLVAAGRYDGTAPVENSEAIARMIPGAELRVYEGGHMFLLQDPSAIGDILDFLADGA